jgi:hypothetical protein
MFDNIELTEGAALGELTGSRYKVRLIEGDRLGSTGYYPASVLASDGPKVFIKGTPMFLDHQSAEQKVSHPNGKIADFVGELAEDAYYENDGLYAEIEVFEHQRPMIKALKDKVGISIRARGLSMKETINGRSVPVVKQLLEARSADFVIKPGAGGKIVALLEEALPEESEHMEEVLKALEALDKKFTEFQESLKPADVVEPKTVVEYQVDYDKTLEIAEQLAASKLGKEGRARVLTLHKADNAVELKTLIEAEESYVQANVGDVINGTVVDAEEQAKDNKTVTLKMPSAWSKK